MERERVMKTLISLIVLMFITSPTGGQVSNPSNSCFMATNVQTRGFTNFMSLSNVAYSSWEGGFVIRSNTGWRLWTNGLGWKAVTP